MDNIMQFLTSVVVLSCLYAMLACGFVVIYKSSRILNFGYSDIVMLTGYLAVTLTQLIAGPPVVALSVGFILSFILGLVIYGLLIKPMAGQPIFSTIILTVALGIVLNAVTILVWGGETEIIPFGWRAYYSLPGEVRVASTEIVMLIVTVVFFVALLNFYRFSKLGQQMRATAENALLASQRGINIYFVTGFAWGVGIFATSVAGTLLGGNYSVSLEMGHVAIKAFAVALVGGLDSIGGTIPAALVVALTELAASNYVNPRLADAIPFMIMIIVLLVRPWGLFGTKEEIDRV
ncbi:MAG: branched-chain amino acid ABC transporter permease [Deltaproteobacteria bacterium]|nr:branched-chain amino acid ABC transporter permease [Deltaproteobacteria bacterium]